MVSPTCKSRMALMISVPDWQQRTHASRRVRGGVRCGEGSSPPRAAALNRRSQPASARAFERQTSSSIRSVLVCASRRDSTGLRQNEAVHVSKQAKRRACAVRAACTPCGRARKDCRWAAPGHRGHLGRRWAGVLAGAEPDLIRAGLPLARRRMQHRHTQHPQ